MSTDELIVIDGHADVAESDSGYSFPLAEALQGGVAAAIVPVRASRIPREAEAESGLREYAQTFEAVEREASASEGWAAIARSSAEIAANAERGVFSFVHSLQNARPLRDLAALEQWLDRGVAIVDFGFIGNNQWAHSSRPYASANAEDGYDGLSGLGEQGIELLNSRGVVIDTAQVSVAARRRILDRSKAPVIASHNGLKARVGEADRTLGDEEIVAIAEGGGLVQIVAFDGYHRFRGEDPKVVADIRELRERFGLPGYRGPADYYALLDPETAEWDEQKFQDYFGEYHAKVRNGWPKTDVADLIDSVDHVVRLVGVDHVGIASDFHHGGGVGGWLDYTQTPNVTAELRRRYDDAEVAKVWGGNLLRVWDDVRSAGDA